MGGDDKNTEPLFAQVSTTELKRILSERFKREVSSAAWRPIALIGVPSLVVLAGLIWGALDSTVTSKVAAKGEEAASKAKEEAKREVELIKNDVPNRVREAFNDQSGQAVQEKLRAALETPSFQAFMQAKINRVVDDAWKEQKEQLRLQFLAQVTHEQDFLRPFSKQVADAMANSGDVPNILAESLETYLAAARPEDTGRTSALALLAAMNQVRANGAVSLLLDKGVKHGQRAMALQGLRHVSFRDVDVAENDAVNMLNDALVAWSAHCAATACDNDADSQRGIESFLARGQELPDKDRARWISRLAGWHEDTLRQNGRTRRVSLYLVPRALGKIGTPEARNTLERWFRSGDTDLALSAAVAIGGQAASLDDSERLLLFKGLWPNLATPETRRAMLAEAAWMALGRVSDGRADPTGAFRPEAAAILGRPLRAVLRGDAARWALARRSDLDRQPALAPPADPCAIGSEAVTQNRATLCALAALIRPERGAAEWSELRQGATVPWDEDEVAILGLLWDIASSRAVDVAPGPAADARLAPLPDLLRMRQPAPAAWGLAATLLVRTAPEQTAWQHLRRLRPGPEDAPLFVAASGWLFRPWTVEHGVFAQEASGLPAPAQRAVLREIAAAAAARPATEAGEADPLPAVVRRLPAPGVAPLNALNFAFAAAPDAALEAVEREDGFRLLQASERGAASGGEAQANMAGVLLAALQDHAGWSRTVVAMGLDGTEPPLAGPRTPLVPSVENRFGRLRLTGGDTFSLRPANPGQGADAFAPVTFYNPRTLETRVLGPRQSWRLPGFAANEWMFRFGAGSPAAQLFSVPAETLALAATATTADIPTIETGRVYTVGALPAGPGRDGGAGDLAGWARLPRLRAGDRIRISTFDLAEGVDTVAELHSGAAELARNDNGGGDAFASRLDWAAEEDGAVLVRFGNLGAPGPFRFAAERLGVAPVETVTSPGRAAFLQDRP